MRHNYRKMITLHIDTLNHLDYAPYAGQYYIDNNGSYYALFTDDKRVSSYLSLPVLWEWLDGYMVALRHVHNVAVQECIV